MQQFSQKLHKDLVSKATQLSNFSLMELQLIIEDKELLIKCMDGLNKSLKQYCKNFLNKKLINLNRNKTLQYILVKTLKKEKQSNC
jgi:hypothetical protein